MVVQARNIDIFKGEIGYVLKARQELSTDIETVFDFFSNAYNLEQITPSWLKFNVKNQAPIAMKTGVIIDYVLRIHGVPMKWRTRINKWQPNTLFIDEQIKGPYRKWVHTHEFEQQKNKKITVCTDVVEYDLFAGWFLNPLFVSNDLRRIFLYRMLKLQDIFAK